MGEYFLPILIGYFVSTAETIGDVTMSCKYSKLGTEGPDFEKRVQDGLLADGVNSFLACLFTSPPNTTFSQNNGVIALTQCASRSAGFSCAFWLILFGVFGKLGAAFNSIPICVVGGVVLQAFTMVFVSGMFIATKHATRRNGVASFHGKNLRHNTGFWPRYKTCKTFPVDSETGAQVRTCTNDNGACCSEYDKGADSNRTTAIILLKTLYAIGFVVALFLHLLLPEDKEEEEEEESGKEMKVDPVEA